MRDENREKLSVKNCKELKQLRCRRNVKINRRLNVLKKSDYLGKRKNKP